MKRVLFFVCFSLILHGCLKGGRPPKRFFEFKRDRTPSSIQSNQCEKPIIIAVLDTGFDAKSTWPKGTPKLCQYGHKDFTDDGVAESAYTKVPVPIDTHGHGTHIAGLIDQYAKKTNSNYCLVIIKYYQAKDYGYGNTIRTIEAIRYAKSIGANFINYSGGGTMTNKEEIQAVKEFIDGGGVFVAAAGNESSDLGVNHYYPAEDDARVVVVGNGKNEYKRAPSSNHGKRINRWEPGNEVWSTLPGGQYGFMAGTSQAAAIATGKIVADKNKSCK
jgi:major intracellular serine protease